MAPVADIGGERVAAVLLSQLASSKGPGSLGIRLPDVVRHRQAVRLSVLLRKLQGALEEKDGDRVEVASLDLTAEPQSLEGDGTSAGEGIEQSGWLAPIAVEDSLSGAL